MSLREKLNDNRAKIFHAYVVDCLCYAVYLDVVVATRLIADELHAAGANAYTKDPLDVWNLVNDELEGHSDQIWLELANSMRLMTCAEYRSWKRNCFFNYVFMRKELACPPGFGGFMKEAMSRITGAGLGDERTAMWAEVAGA